jgi:hypothetical protein
MIVVIVSLAVANGASFALCVLALRERRKTRRLARASVLRRIHGLSTRKP